jgi:hypothetical protein
MIRRYIFRLATMEFSVGGRSLDDRIEKWMGIEIESIDPIDLEEFSRRTGKHLVPCEGMSEGEIASCGVTKFERIQVT